MASMAAMDAIASMAAMASIGHHRTPPGTHGRSRTRGAMDAIASMEAVASIGHHGTPPGAPHGRSRARASYSGTMSGAPSRAASAVRSSSCRWDSRSASTRFS